MKLLVSKTKFFSSEKHTSKFILIQTLIFCVERNVSTRRHNLLVAIKDICNVIFEIFQLKFVEGYFN